MSEPFKYIDELDNIPIEDDGPSSVEITGIKNLIPLHVNFKINGEAKSFLIYMNYEAQEVVIPDKELEGYPDFPKEEFEEKVIYHLQRRSLNYPINMPESPNPSEIYRPVVLPEGVSQVVRDRNKYKDQPMEDEDARES